MKTITRAAAVAASTLLLGATAAVGTPPTADAAGTVNLTGYGADSCAAPSTSAMSAFWNNTPFSYWGVYIGGSSRGCAQPNLTSSWVTTVVGQGWDLLPIWVGPQNPCGSGFSSYFSTDPNTAYGQGKQEAIAAYHAWQGISADSNVPIEYDLEGVSGETDQCRTAAKSFINGWVEQMHVAPAQAAGIYSSACGGNLADFATIANKPDFIDAADWDDDPNVNNISCVSGSDWTGLKRHKQYQGDHDATYNGVTINIDSRCSNGPVYGAADHTSTTHGCVGTAAARAALQTAATDSAPVTWHGATWLAGGPLSSQLRRDAVPVRITGLPLRLSNVPSDAATVGDPAVLDDGSLMIPVTVHTGKRAATRIYSTTDGKHFRLRTTVPLRGSYGPGVAPATALRSDRSVAVLDADAARTATWSPRTGSVRLSGSHGLPGGPQSVRFTGETSGRAVVEATRCSSKTNCSPNPTTYFTSDGGRTWHR